MKDKTSAPEWIEQWSRNAKALGVCMATLAEHPDPCVLGSVCQPIGCMVADYADRIGQVLAEVHLVMDEYEARGYVSIKNKMEQEVIALQHLGSGDDKVRRLDRCIAQVQTAVEENRDLVTLKEKLVAMRAKLSDLMPSSGR